MSRLTKKDKRGNYYTVAEEIGIGGKQVNPITNWIEDCEERNFGNPIDKLGKLEDLEEQLGCPLEFIFKVLKAPKIYIEGMNVNSEYDDRNKFHAKSNNYIINPYAIDGLKPQFLFVDRYSYGYDLRLKDYKKTWWLKEDKSE